MSNKEEILSLKAITGDFFAWVGNRAGREKITFGSRNTTFHYTIIFKGEKKCIDVHKAIQFPDGKKEYESLFEMRTFTFLRLMVMFSRFNDSLLRRFWFNKRINIDKLNHPGLILFPLTGDEYSVNLFFDIQKSKRLKVKSEIDIESLSSLFITPKEVFQSNYNSFWIFSSKRKYHKCLGLLFKYNNTINEPGGFYLVSKRNLRRYKEAVCLTLFKLLNQIDFKNKEQIILQLANRLMKD